MNTTEKGWRRIVGVAGVAVLSTFVVLSGVGSVQASAPRASVALQGAGSTFVGPEMLGGWIPGYKKLHPDVSINYSLTGSGTGISLWTKGTVDFAASDALLNATQEAAASSATACNSNVTHIPATIGAVALVYNLPGVPSGIKLNADVVSRIFLGQIHEWADLRIAHLNPGVKLPQRPITVVHRADGSGTTYITTHYLAAVSPAWNSLVGSGSTVKWRVGIGATGSSGIAANVARTQGAIGYVDLAYAINAKLSTADVQNAAGAYIAPGVASAGSAANSFVDSMPSDLQQLIVNSKAKDAYPITGYSYIFLCSTQTGDKGKTLVDFVKYVVTTGQSAAAPRYYAPLPKSVQTKDLAALSAISVK